MSQVKIKVIFFAKSRELAGKREDYIEVPETIAYKTFLEQISSKYQLEYIKNSLFLALNETYLEPECVIKFSKGDTIAIIPPVSSG